MPSASATRQACWPPAPPKQLRQVAGDVIASLHRYLLDGVGHVLDCDGDEALGAPLYFFLPTCGLVARQILEGVWPPASRSSGWSWPGPKMAGKKPGCSLPSITLASVTVSGPSRR